MGSVLYDYLHDRLLFDVSLIRARFASVSDDALWKELHEYREFCLSHADDLRAEIQGGQGKLRLFGGHSFQSERRLRQAALYVDTVVLPDPLFELSRQRSDQARTLDRFLNMPQREKLDRTALTRAAAFMVRTTPLVAVDYIKFFPSSYYSEPPVQLPLRGPEATFRLSLPEELRRVYEDSTVIRSLERTELGWRIGDQLERGRGISIQFDHEGHFYGYHLFENIITEVDEVTREFQARLTLPDTPPDEQQFRLWVDQSVDRAVEQDLRAITTDLAIAAACDSMYVTDSAFSGRVLDARFGAMRDVVSDTASQVLNLELPILEDVGIDDIMRIRADDGEAFASFRREVEKQFAALRLERDPDQLRTRLQNVVHELTVAQVEQARQKIASLQKQLFVHGVVGIAGLAGTIVTSGWSLAATALALASGAKDFADYQAKKHENPGYFLWRVMGGKRR
jgi:hypothetical protein